MKNVLQKYKAVSQECRLRVLHLLVKAKTPLCICELMDILNRPQYNISRCLITLKDAGLVKEEREGRLLLHSLETDDPFNRTLFKSIAAIDLRENPDMLVDLDNMKERLTLRESGKVVVTY